MAEAAVEDRPPMPTRYYCHRCNTEINIPNTDYTCPICASGFVEELPSGQQGLNSSPGSSRTPVGGTGTGVGPESGASTSRGNNSYVQINSLRGELASLLRSRNPPIIEFFSDTPALRPRGVNTGTNTPGTIPGNTSGGSGAVQMRTGGGRVRPQHLDRFDNVLLDFLQSLSSGDPAIGNSAFAFGNQMFFLGNPGDYAWGREGIDTIVTQLLNQMETSGPPPLSEERIAEIPTVLVTQEDVDKKVQCSVCWEDFQLNENVRKLSCAHIYHENCIVPWLELHSTCPICRKELNGDGDNTLTGGSGASGGEDEPFLFSNRRSNLNGNGRSGGGGSGSGTTGGHTTVNQMQNNSALDDLD